MLLLSLFILAVGVFAWVQWVEPNWFHLRQKTVRVRKFLPRPLSVLHLSDLHFTKPHFFLERFFDKLATLDVDLIFVTGDLIDAPEGIDRCVTNLSKLKPNKGVYIVFGNHDYRNYPWFDRLGQLTTGKHYGIERPETDQLRQALRKAGFHLLENEHARVALVDGRELNVIGIDDPVTGRANLNQAFHGLEDGVLQLALIHSPMGFPSLSHRGVDIAFAGHTHGGQLRLPGIGPFPLVHYLEPIIDSTDRYGFAGLVSRGLGAGPTLRFRLFCRPEAVLVRIEGT